MERMLNAEMDVHLGEQGEREAGNHRNGSSRKTVLGDDGELVLSIPRDRQGRSGGVAPAPGRVARRGYSRALVVRRTPAAAGTAARHRLLARRRGDGHHRVRVD